jgi:hypothetical protein
MTFDGTPEDDAAQPEPATDETTAADSAVMELLSERVPLSLLMDLTAPAGPDSEAILDEEGEPEDAWWEPR